MSYNRMFGVVSLAATPLAPLAHYCEIEGMNMTDDIFSLKVEVLPHIVKVTFQYGNSKFRVAVLKSSLLQDYFRTM